MEFTHFDDNKNAVMVDVSDKDITNRVAVATGRITLWDKKELQSLFPCAII